jgi:hypothetical protein
MLNEHFYDSKEKMWSRLFPRGHLSKDISIFYPGLTFRDRSQTINASCHTVTLWVSVSVDKFENTLVFSHFMSEFTTEVRNSQCTTCSLSIVVAHYLLQNVRLRSFAMHQMLTVPHHRHCRNAITIIQPPALAPLRYDAVDL